MADTRKTKIAGKIVFLWLILFPFGQLINIGRFHPIDLVAWLGMLFIFEKKPDIFKYLKNFILLALFSLVISLSFLNLSEIEIGLLYFLRFLFYILFFIMIWNFVKVDVKIKDKIFYSLIFVSVATAIFGWAQYIFLPDLRDLKYLGWDDHYFRLVGTFLDPGFTGIILVFGFLLALTKFVYKKRPGIFFLLIFLMLTIAFTYSRASYLALFAGIFTISFLKKTFKVSIFLTTFFLLLVLLLPRPSGSGVQLERTYSIKSRFVNYSETLSIFKKSPIFGAGFNNICVSRQKLLGVGDFGSHSCSGSDSSLLLVLATTGIIGFVVFIHAIYKILRSINKDIYGMAFYSSFVALAVHSLFVNSIFYPWIMGWMGLLTAIALK